MTPGRLGPLLVLLLACGPSGPGKSPQRKDAGVADPAPRDAPAALAPLALGMPDLASFGYRARTGHAAFKLARDGEAAGDWAAVVSRCREALAADPEHLDAAYLLAVALAKTNAGAEAIVAPLAKAVAGDFAKWGAASLEQPALQPFLATPLGRAWRRRVEEERPAFLAALGRSLVVTAAGDLFAYDLETARWYRLTRTGGAVVAALHVRSQQRLVYVTREKVTEQATSRTRIGIGLVEIAAGRTRRAIEVGEVAATAALRIGYSTKKPPGFIVRAGKLAKAAWRLVEEPRLSLERVPAKARPDVPAYLADRIRMDVIGRSVRIDRVAVEDVIADWDDSSLASAIKIGRSKRVVTVPSPGLIDGDTATWSTDRTQLAFVAQLSDECARGVATGAAFVADAATGSVRELERATGGIAIEWVAERRLAIAGDRGVSIVDLGGGDPIVLGRADGLVTPRRMPTCAVPAEPPDAEPEPDPDVGGA